MLTLFISLVKVEAGLHKQQMLNEYLPVLLAVPGMNDYGN